MSFSRINEIPWNKLGHAYGTAADVPEMLDLLLSDDTRTRDEVLLDLSNKICHQGTRYSASAATVPFLFELLKTPAYSEKAEIIGFLLGLAFGLNELVPPEMINRPKREDWENLIEAEQEFRGLPIESNIKYNRMLTRRQEKNDGIRVENTLRYS